MCAGWTVTLTAASSPCLASCAPLQPGRLQKQPAWPWSWQRPRGQRPTEALCGTRCSAEPGSRPGGTEEAAAWSGGHFCTDLGPERPAGLPAPLSGPVACEGLGSAWREGLTWIPGHRETLGCLVRIARVHAVGRLLGGGHGRAELCVCPAAVVAGGCPVRRGLPAVHLAGSLGSGTSAGRQSCVSPASGKGRGQRCAEPPAWGGG